MLPGDKSSVADGPPGADDDAEMVGLRLRQVRRLRRATLKEIAERSGLSESYLSQIERGRTQGSVGSLKRITMALGISMAELFEPDLANRPQLLRKADREHIDFGENARKTMLTSRPLEHLEVFVGELQPGGSTGEPYSHGDSEELLLILNGRARLELDREVFELEKGDSVFYRSSSLHRLSNPHDAEAEVLWVISPPSY
jgi:transcriptional regulator with XRE-family HTH domain